VIGTPSTSATTSCAWAVVAPASIKAAVSTAVIKLPRRAAMPLCLIALAPSFGQLVAERRPGPTVAAKMNAYSRGKFRTRLPAHTDAAGLPAGSAQLTNC
jgi:hypothetical protein